MFGVSSFRFPVSRKNIRTRNLEKYLKGQSAMELLVTFGLILAFSLPVLFLLLSISGTGSEDSAKAQADASARSLAESMNLVYAQGPGAKRLVALNLPPSTQNVTVKEGEVVVNIKIGAGSYEAISPTIAKIRPSVLYDKTGLFPVIVRTNNNFEVELTNVE